MSQALVASPTVEVRGHRRTDHLHAIDIVRLLTFACVVGVHAVPLPTSPDSQVAGGLLTLLHFTRDTFFLLSSFVLFHVYYRRDFSLRTFWGRRFLFVALPYTVWTVVYWALLDGRLPTLASNLVFGTAQYHLYFLLVSMQLYVAFPFLRWLVRRTSGHHGLLFAVSLAVQVAFLWAILWKPWTGWFLDHYQRHAYALLPTYQFYFIAGGLAAVHYRRFHDLVTRYRHLVPLGLLGALALQEGVYAYHLQREPVAGASDALQPSMVLWSLAMTIAFYALGCAYAEWRHDGRTARFVDLASTVSFGVYLMHPLILNGVLQRWLNYPSALPAVPSVLLAWTVPLVVSFAVMAVVIRTPLALALAGRRRQSRSAPIPGSGSG